MSKKVWSRGGLVVGMLMAAIVVAQFSTGHALAAVKTWTGTAGDHKFSTAGNWSPSGAPTNGDSLVFPNTVTDKAPDNDISSLSVAGITLNGSASDSVTVSGNAFTNTGGLTNSATGGFLSISAPMAVSGAQTFATGNSYGIDLTGALSGSGAITRTGTSYLYLSADNSGFTGTITNSAGYLSVTSATALGASSAGTTIASGSALLVCFTSDLTIAEPITIGGDGISSTGAFYAAACGGGGTVGATATLTGAVTLTSNTTVGGYNSNILKLTGALSGSYTLTIAEGIPATLVIAASSNSSQTPNGTYASPTKTTTIPAGDDSPSTYVSVGVNNIYIIDGVRGDTDVFGKLMGTGTVGLLTVANDAIVAPGHSPGCLTATGGLNMSGTYEAEIGGTTACTGYDQLRVTGTVGVTGTTLSTSLYGGFKPAKGQVYTIIDNDGSDAVTGTFANLAEGATFTISGNVFKVSYVGGTGNDVTLTVMSVPAVPNTGVQFITGNPVLVSVIGLVAAGTLVVLSRKLGRSRR